MVIILLLLIVIYYGMPLPLSLLVMSNTMHCPDDCYSDRHELVLVTHIRDPCQFMIQRVADVEQLQIMMNIINMYCDSTENVHDLLYEVKSGMLLS